MFNFICFYFSFLGCSLNVFVWVKQIFYFFLFFLFYYVHSPFPFFPNAILEDTLPSTPSLFHITQKSHLHPLHNTFPKIKKSFLPCNSSTMLMSLIIKLETRFWRKLEKYDHAIIWNMKSSFAQPSPLWAHGVAHGGGVLGLILLRYSN